MTVHSTKEEVIGKDEIYVEDRNLLLGLLEKQGVISIVEYEETNGEYIAAETDIADVYLTEDEFAAAETISKRFMSFNCSKISEYSHNGKAGKKLLPVH